MKTATPVEEKKHEVRTIPLANIVPDESQPRKDFNIHRLADLKKSIEAHGIITPLVVEAHGNMYLLVDGERRFRAANEMGLKEVPALIQEPSTGVDRLIKQFHIQEQHEGWSNTEKAAAVIDLAKQLNLSVKAVSDLLAIPDRTIGRYLSFGKLLSRDVFQKEEISLEWAQSLVRMREHTKRVYLNALEEEFDKGQEKQLEHAIIRRIKSGDIKTDRDMMKLRDSISSNPKIVETFIKNDKVSLEKLFLDSHAKGEFAFRNLISAARSLASYTNTGLPIGLKKLVDNDEEAQRVLKSARHAIGQLI